MQNAKCKLQKLKSAKGLSLVLTFLFCIFYFSLFILPLKYRFSLMPFRGLLVGESDSEDRGFVKVFADDLHADGQIFRIKAAGKRKARESGEVHRDGKYVRKIHLQRVLSFFSDPKGRSRRRRGDNRIAFFKCFLEILLDQRPDSLGLEIISIVIAGG